MALLAISTGGYPAAMAAFGWINEVWIERDRTASDKARPDVMWARETAGNPRVIRVHTTVELTRATIETCPPASPPEGLSSVLAVDGVRSVDLHRYRARLNLNPGCAAEAVWDGWRGPSRRLGGLPLHSPANLRHEGSRSPTEDPGSWPRARRWPLPMQPSRHCSGPRGGRGHP